MLAIMRTLYDKVVVEIFSNLFECQSIRTAGASIFVILGKGAKYEDVEEWLEHAKGCELVASYEIQQLSGQQGGNA